MKAVKRMRMTEEDVSCVVMAGPGVSAPPTLAPSTSGNLELMDMPEGILQLISTFVFTKEWARVVTRTCRKLNALPLPVMKVGHENLACSQPDVFAWMGKRIAETTYLAIDIDCRGALAYSCTSEYILYLLYSSNQYLNANMETLVLTQTCRCSRRSHSYFDRIDCDNATGLSMARLQEAVMLPSVCPKIHTVSLSLDKAPSWRVHGPSLRHMCLQIPPSTAIVESEWPEVPPHAKNLYDFMQMFGMHSRNLPSLQTLFLRGMREPVQLRGVDFRDSKTLEFLNVRDCWIDDLSVPQFCSVSVSAQSTFMISRMDRFPEHPLVSRAHNVCLPTDLDEVDEYHLQTDHRLRQRLALGIPDIFPSMRSLRMTWPDESIRCFRYHSPGCFIDCFSNDPRRAARFAKVKMHHMQGLSRHWQHVNLRELLIEGQSLSVTIPALPRLETLLVHCKESVALDFVDPCRLGRTVTKMTIIGTQILFLPRQRHNLCTALNTRGLGLVGDWERCIAVHRLNNPAPPMAELLQQAMRGLACQCRACPSCLGIGESVRDKEDSRGQSYT